MMSRQEVTSRLNFSPYPSEIFGIRTFLYRTPDSVYLAALCLEYSAVKGDSYVHIAPGGFEFH